MQEGRIDVGIICTIPNKDFESFFLSDDKMCVVMPKGYPLEERKEIPMKLLADYPLVLYRDDFNLHDDILSNCKKIGFTPKIVFETSQRDLMLQTVSSGLGVGDPAEPPLSAKQCRWKYSRPPADGTENDPPPVCDLEERALPLQSGPVVD